MTKLRKWFKNTTRFTNVKTIERNDILILSLIDYLVYCVTSIQIVISELTFTCAKSTIETREKGVKYFQS